MLQVTARKYRPKSFQTMVGQQHVLQPLINSLTQQRLHHAYLFTGTRGVGKTTLARILAKCLECEKGISPEPCGTCEACQSIDQGSFVDVLEIDAASRTKVEDTRDLLDNVQYLPTQGRFKIYIIDEVHMLSTSSFNALLKTLEEPPSHVKFILATTDPQKLPPTVLSRCLQFHLKHLESDLIAQQLATILKTENIPFDEEAIQLLAQAGQGSMRDALSLLDQAIAHGSNAVQTGCVRAMLGTLDPKTVTQILSALQAQDGIALMQAVEDIAMDSGNFAQALEALIQALHDIALLQIVPGAAQLSQPRYARVQPFARAFTPDQIQLYYQIALHGRRDLPWAPSSRAGFEMACLRLLAFEPVIGIDVEVGVGVPLEYSSGDAAPKCLSTDEAIPLEDEFVADYHPKMEPVIVQKIPPNPPLKRGESTFVTPPLKRGEKVLTSNLPPWEQLLPQLKLTGMASALASHCVLGNFNGHLLVLHLAHKHAPLYTKSVSDRIAQALTEQLKQPISVEVKLIDEVADTPAQRRQEADDEAFAQAKSQLESDPVVQQLVETFGAKIDESSLKRS